jgi:hypothetical protein
MYKESEYFKVGKASDLTGKDRVLYRVLEILPGFLSWFTIVAIFLSSYFVPFYAAIFIILFDIYWLLKTVYLSIYLRSSFKKIKHNLHSDWKARISNLKYGDMYQMVLFPYYKESREVIEHSIKSIIKSNWNKKKIILVLASEERAGEEYIKVGIDIAKKYKDVFFQFILTVHPKDTVGEIAGKGSNISYSAEKARVDILDKNNIDYKKVLVSAFDIDTSVYPDYFNCLTWNFLTSEKPLRSSFQPVPLYYNNVWDTPALSRVASSSSTFWQMIQQERPEKQQTFSSHSISFHTLYEAGYWQKNIVSEDSRIFFNCLLAFDGDYRVIPIYYPILMDANLSDNFWTTAKNIYKQHRRWGWGVENLPYAIFNFIKNKNISLKKKLLHSFVLIEGFWSLATNPLIIFFLGWLPLWLGGRLFNETLLAYNLPVITRDLMFLAMLGLIGSAIISMSFLPDRPERVSKRYYFFMILQWILVPFTIIVFGAIPGLDAQTRLMFGKYMGFWVTPKHRKKYNV